MTSGWPFYVHELQPHPSRKDDEDVFADEREQNEQAVYLRDIRSSWLDPVEPIVDAENKS